MADELTDAIERHRPRRSDTSGRDYCIECTPRECDVAPLVARLRATEAALRAEWEANHDEHCSNVSLVDGACGLGRGCHWPPPEHLAALGGRAGAD